MATLHPKIVVQALALSATLLSATSFAEKIVVPISLPEQFIAQTITTQIFTLKNNSVRINDDGSGCQYLELSDPKIKTKEGYVNIIANAEARVGRLFAGNCILLFDWNGSVDLDQNVIVDKGRNTLRAEVREVRVFNSDGTRAAASNIVWQWSESYLQSALTFDVVDLRTPISRINQVLSHFLGADLPSADPLPLSFGVDSVVIRPGTVTAQLVVESGAPKIPNEDVQQEAVLSESELAQFEERLNALDGFFTYVIKKTVNTDTNDDLRERYFESLIELRYALGAALVEHVERGKNDPIRQVFVEQWNQLAPLLADSAQQTTGGSAMNVFAFIAGADALTALDKLGPGFGLDISTDGLRRLARLLVPDDATDPTAFGEEIDSELENDFGLGGDIPPEPMDMLPKLLDFLVSPAYGAVTYDAALLKKLNGWIPKTSDMDNYLPMVYAVIDHKLAELLKRKGLESEFVDVFRDTVVTAAWQESCWRQYVNDKGKRMPLRSGAGDIGLMQVNPRVWRGFYDAHGLKWDIAYNVASGADILLHYFTKYAVKKQEHKVTGKLDNLGRATYSAYNGGPKSLTRYRRKDASAHGLKVDKAFYEKYQLVRNGDRLAVRSCYTD